MKRIFGMLLVLSLLAFPVLAAPLPLLEDYTAEISHPYDEGDPSAGTFVYSCRYPHADDAAEGGSEINAFYEYLMNDTLDNYVPLLQDAYEGYDSSMTVSYTVTCNTDDYFSVLVRTERNNPDLRLTTWEGHVFSRKNGSPGQTYTLPKVLGILAADENDEWLQNRQTEKANNIIREMVWNMIQDNPEGLDYGDITEEILAYIFFPEENFYLDENGNPVFYLQPGDLFSEVPEGTGLFTFPIALDDILDEL